MDESESSRIIREKMRKIKKNESKRGLGTNVREGDGQLLVVCTV